MDIWYVQLFFFFFFFWRLYPVTTRTLDFLKKPFCLCILITLVFITYTAHQPLFCSLVKLKREKRVGNVPFFNDLLHHALHNQRRLIPETTDSVLLVIKGLHHYRSLPSYTQTASAAQKPRNVKKVYAFKNQPPSNYVNVLQLVPSNCMRSCFSKMPTTIQKVDAMLRCMLYLWAQALLWIHQE